METNCDVCGGRILYESRRYSKDGDIQILENMLMGVERRIPLAVEVDTFRSNNDLVEVTICKVCLDAMVYEMNWA
jgi:hypothetical protein